MFTACADSWPFGQLTIYDPRANCTFAQVVDEHRDEINVEERAE